MKAKVKKSVPSSKKETAHDKISEKQKYHDKPRWSRRKLEIISQQLGNLLLTLAGTNLAEAQRLSNWLLFEQNLRLYYSKAGL